MLAKDISRQQIREIGVELSRVIGGGGELKITDRFCISRIPAANKYLFIGDIQKIDCS
jgi:hypothetical protein